MVLDVELFRADKGNDPLKVRENQAKRFKDVTLVDKVVEHDQRWRRCELKFHHAFLFSYVIHYVHPNLAIYAVSIMISLHCHLYVTQLELQQCGCSSATARLRAHLHINSYNVRASASESVSEPLTELCLHYIRGLNSRSSEAMAILVRKGQSFFTFKPGTCA